MNMVIRKMRYLNEIFELYGEKDITERLRNQIFSDKTIADTVRENKELWNKVTAYMSKKEKK